MLNYVKAKFDGELHFITSLNFFAGLIINNHIKGISQE